MDTEHLTFWKFLEIVWNKLAPEFQQCILFGPIFLFIINAHGPGVDTNIVYLASILIVLLVVQVRHGLKREVDSNLRLWPFILGGIVLMGVAFLFSAATFRAGNIDTVLIGFPRTALRATWEEIAFRGLLFALFIQARSRARILSLAVLSSLLFTLAHFGNFLKHSQPDSYVAIAFLMGLLLCVLYLLTKNLVFTSVVHTAYNLMIGLTLQGDSSFPPQGALIFIVVLTIAIIGLGYLWYVYLVGQPVYEEPTIE